MKFNHSEGLYYDYYYFYHLYNDTYEIESFQRWEGVADIGSLNIAFVVVSIVVGVLDLLLLVTIFSASVRERSASWYLYHLNFVTILHCAFSLPRLEVDLHLEFGSCMFFSFTEWTFQLVYYVNLALMDIEILTTILTSTAKWKANPMKRFFISMTVSWISCILFAVFIKFFGHEENRNFPICFHEKKSVAVIGNVTRGLLPAIVTVIMTIVGLVLFIRTKKRPENYTHISANQGSLQIYNEWFACFMACNVLVLFTKVLNLVMLEGFFQLGLHADIILLMAITLAHVCLPMICLILEPVRTTCFNWAKTVVHLITGITRSGGSSVSDTEMLSVETGE